MSRLCSLLLILAVTSSHNISFIVAKGDACDESTSTCEPEIYVGDDNMSSTWEFMSAFSKLGTSWNHVIGECELPIYVQDVHTYIYFSFLFFLSSYELHQTSPLCREPMGKT